MFKPIRIRCQSARTTHWPPTATSSRSRKVLTKACCSACKRSGGVPGAEKGTLAIMAGGRAEDIERARPIVMHMAQRFTRMGDSGAGQATKLCNQVIVGSLLPVIAEVSRKAGVRPERPMSIAVIASQQAITACPISAATVALLGILGPSGITLGQILLVCIPSTFLGCMIGALSVAWKGKELADDPGYRKLLAEGKLEEVAAPRRLTGAELPSLGTT